MASTDTYPIDSIKEQQKFIIKMDDQEHAVDVKLYKDGEISTSVEAYVTKLKYRARLNAKDILELTKNSKMELDPEHLYKLITLALSNQDDGVKYVCKTDGSYINFKLIWQISTYIAREFDLVFAKTEVSDVERMSKIFQDFICIKDEMRTVKLKEDELSKEIKTLQDDLAKSKQEGIETVQDFILIGVKDIMNAFKGKEDKLLEEIKTFQDELHKYKQEGIKTLQDELAKIKQELTQKTNNIVNVTTYSDNTRRAYVAGEPVIKFNVIKKYPDTVLFVSANLCVHGENNAESCQIWKYGGTTTYGQSDDYASNNGYARSVTCYCKIVGHTEVGSHELQLSWLSNITPFYLINPNKTDHVNFGECQTCSIIRVEEIRE
jgi:hypothetical protein